jgi:hypothetical protein
MRAFVLAALLLALTATPAAAAGRCVAPPGTGAVDEYCETVPTDHGNRGSGDTGSNGPAISDKTITQLAASGTDGQELAQAIGADPTKLAAAVGAKAKRPHGSKVVPAVAVPDAPSSNPLNAVREAVGGNSTIGSGFIIALIVIVLLMAGWGWIAFRRRPTAS